VSYFCVGPEADFKVLAELMTADGDLGIKNSPFGQW
jgi:hypothetical protein